MAEGEYDFINSQIANPTNTKKAKFTTKNNSLSSSARHINRPAGSDCTECVKLNAYNYQLNGTSYTPVQCYSCNQVNYTKKQQKLISLTGQQGETTTSGYSGYEFANMAYGTDPQTFYQQTYKQGYEAGYEAGYKAAYEAAYQAARTERIMQRTSSTDEKLKLTVAATEPSSSSSLTSSDTFDAYSYADNIQNKSVQNKINSMNALLDSIDNTKKELDSTNNLLIPGSQHDKAVSKTNADEHNNDSTLKSLKRTRS